MFIKAYGLQLFGRIVFLVKEKFKMITTRMLLQLTNII